MSWFTNSLLECLFGARSAPSQHAVDDQLELIGALSVKCLEYERRTEAVLETTTPKEDRDILLAFLDDIRQVKTAALAMRTELERNSLCHLAMRTFQQTKPSDVDVPADIAVRVEESRMFVNDMQDMFTRLLTPRMRSLPARLLADVAEPVPTSVTPKRTTTLTQRTPAAALIS